MHVFLLNCATLFWVTIYNKSRYLHSGRICITLAGQSQTCTSVNSLSQSITVKKIVCLKFNNINLSCKSFSKTVFYPKWGRFLYKIIVFLSFFCLSVACQWRSFLICQYSRFYGHFECVSFSLLLVKDQFEFFTDMTEKAKIDLGYTH